MLKQLQRGICYCLLLGNSYAFAQNWTSVGGGVNYMIHSFYSDTDSNRLYIGGQFALAGGQPATGICYWDGSNFHSVGCGVDWDCVTPINNNSTNIVADIIKYKNDIYICGGFVKADNKPIKYLARWNGNTWDSADVCPNNIVRDMLVTSNNELIVVGDFDHIGGINCNGVAKWDGTIWSPLGTGIPFNYYDYLIYSVCEYNHEIYVGGNFSDNNYNELVKWDGSNWVSPGINFYGAEAAVNATIVYNNKLYVGGMFTANEGNISNYIVTYDGSNWTDVGGGGQGTNGQVWSMAIHNNELYVSGAFQGVGEIPAKFLAKWDGANWCSFGTNFINPIYRVCSYNNELYISCSKTIEADTVNYVAKWIGGNYVDTCGNTTGIKEIETNKDTFTIYPNPSSDHIYIESNLPTTATLLKVYNLVGQQVYAEKLQTNTPVKKAIDVSSWGTGVYIIQLVSNQSAVSKKFIKQ